MFVNNNPQSKEMEMKGDTKKNVPFQTVPAILFYNGIINISAQGKLLQRQSKLLYFN